MVKVIRSLGLSVASLFAVLLSSSSPSEAFVRGSHGDVPNSSHSEQARGETIPSTRKLSCNIEINDNSTDAGSTGDTTSFTFDYYVSVGARGPVSEDLVQALQQDIFNGAHFQVLLCQNDEPESIATTQNDTTDGGARSLRELGVSDLTMESFEISDYLCPANLRSIVNRTLTTECDVMRGSILVTLLETDSVEDAAATIRSGIWDAVSLDLVFSRYAPLVTFVEYLGDSVSGAFPQPDSPLRDLDDEDGPIVALNEGDRSVSADSGGNNGLAIGLGIGITALVALVGLAVYHSRLQKDHDESTMAHDADASTAVA